MSPNSSRKFFDVAQPGQTAPSATSRPVVPNKSPTEDPFLHKPVQPPLKVPPRVAPPKPADPTLDPKALLIQAGDFTPLKATKSNSQHFALAAMVVVLLLLCAASYWLVTTM